MCCCYMQFCFSGSYMPCSRTPNSHLNNQPPCLSHKRNQLLDYFSNLPNATHSSCLFTKQKKINKEAIHVGCESQKKYGHVYLKLILLQTYYQLSIFPRGGSSVGCICHKVCQADCGGHVKGFSARATFPESHFASFPLYCRSYYTGPRGR